MTQNDNIAVLIFLFCAIWNLMYLAATDNLFRMMCFSLFLLFEVVHSLVWVANWWTACTWSMPIAGIFLAAAAAESSWNIAGELGKREKIWSRIFSAVAGVAFATFVVIMKPLFPKFPPVSFMIAMALTGFAAGCTISAVMYWWANRSQGVRPFVREGLMLSAYAVVIVVSAVVSSHSDDLWDASVQLSSVTRAALLVAATLSLARRGLVSAHA